MNDLLIVSECVNMRLLQNKGKTGFVTAFFIKRQENEAKSAGRSRGIWISCHPIQ